MFVIIDFLFLKKMLSLFFFFLFFLHAVIIIISVSATSSYTPSNGQTTCTTGDGTANWNSFGNNINRGPFANSDPGICANGTTLFYPWMYTDTFSSIYEVALSGNPTLTVISVPSVYCVYWPVNQPLITNSSSSNSAYSQTAYGNGISTSTSYWYTTDLPSTFPSWGVHILQGYMCTFTCPLYTTINPAFQYQTSLYSDGFRSMCHPSKISPVTGKCTPPILDQISAPYCDNHPTPCIVQLTSFSYLLCTSGLQVAPVTSGTDFITVQPGDTCTISSVWGSWNTAWYADSTTSYPFYQSYTFTCINSYIEYLDACIDDFGFQCGQPITYYSPRVGATNPQVPMTSCPSNFYGPYCLPCPVCSVQGVGFYYKCNDGATGDGTCQPYNVCQLRTIHYLTSEYNEIVTFNYDLLSSTGRCVENQAVAFFYVDVPDPLNPVGGTIHIGLGIPTTIPSWITTYGVKESDEMITMTLVGSIPNMPNGTAYPSSVAICNGRGSIYGNFTAQIYEWTTFPVGIFYLSSSNYFPTAPTLAGSLPICECYPGFWGNECQNVCQLPLGQQQQGMICDASDGHARCPILNGGLTDNNGNCIQPANTTCPFNQYGPLCQYDCPICTAPTTACNKTTGKCTCPNPLERVSVDGSTCTPYHCGDPDSNGHYCNGGSSKGGTCTLASNNITQTCYCNEGYHGQFCTIQPSCTQASCGGQEYLNRDCDCGVVWLPPYSLSTINQSISIIGLLGDNWYRDNYLSASYFDIIGNTNLNTANWLIPVLYNQPMSTPSQAQDLVYKYRQADGFLWTPYNNSNYGFMNPFQFVSNQEAGPSITLSISLNQIWYESIGNPVSNASQVAVYQIERTYGYDCFNDQLDLYWYFMQNWYEIVVTYGYRYCDQTQRDNTTNNNCCLDQFHSVCCGYNQWSTEDCTSLIPFNNEPMAQWVQRHYDEIGHRERLSPNSNCDFWPTIYEENNLCGTLKSGCTLGSNSNTACNGRGRCRVTGTEGTNSNFKYPYECVCRRYGYTGGANSDYYQVLSSLSEASATTLTGFPQYIGYGCEYDLTNCIDPNPINGQTICNDQPIRCLGTTYPANSSLATPGTLLPQCNCGAIPSLGLDAPAPGQGEWCQQSRCGNGVGCLQNATIAKCVASSTNSTQFECQCSLNEPWIGELCNVYAQTCMYNSTTEGSSSITSQVQCNGAGYGTCTAAGTGFKAGELNYNSSFPWCNCVSSNYTGIHCSVPECLSSIVLPGHGYCIGALSNKASCFPMWGCVDTTNCLLCNISLCAPTGGIPTNSDLPGSLPQDICNCSLAATGKSNLIMRTDGPRPGFLANDANSAKYGLCGTACPNYNGIGYCGGTNNGYCQDNSANTTIGANAVCVCNYGYQSAKYYDTAWQSYQQVCLPYCSVNGSLTQTPTSSQPIGTSLQVWNNWASNPHAYAAPVCNCIGTSGYWNDPNTGHTTCIDYRCYNGGSWISNGAGGSGSCLCTKNSLYTSVSYCNLTTCTGTTTGVTRGFLNTLTNKCICNPPFTWVNSVQQQECNSDLCQPNGVIINTTSTSMIPNLALTNSALCSCNYPYKTSTSTSCPVNQALYCSSYCTSSICANGGVVYFSSSLNKWLCTCPSPYLSSENCETSTCNTLYGVPNITSGGCDCLYGWTNSVLSGLCGQDPCSHTCKLGSGQTTTNCGGTFNAVSKSCVCTSGWTGPFCTLINSTTATANCSGHGSAVNADECICNLLWSGTNCQTLVCVAEGSTTAISPITGAEICVCPTGYTGSICDAQVVITSSDGTILTGTALAAALAAQNNTSPAAVSSSSSSTTQNTIIAAVGGSVGGILLIGVIAGIIYYYYYYFQATVVSAAAAAAAVTVAVPP